MTDFKELREALDAVEHSAMAFERCPDAHTGRRLNDARKKLLDRLEAAERDAERLDKLEEAVRQSGMRGLSFDWCKHVEDGYVVEKGFRFMRRHNIGERCNTLRAAIDAMKEQQP